MGFLKKLTKPLSKFLDKIVPNELKPALPYLSAFAPYMLGPGIMGSSMLQRALISGGLNIGSQLAQEGSEGEFSGLSALLAAGQGAMTAPGTPGTAGTTLPGQATPGATPGAEQFFREKAIGMEPGWMKSGTEALGTGAEYLTGASKTLSNDLFSIPGMKAATVPLSHGTADLSMAVARKADRDYQRQMEEDEAQDFANDEGRRRAIRAAMEAGGHSEEAILDALASLGLRSGGIVSLRDGGQLVKRGPGRPGYAGRWDDPGMSPGQKHDPSPQPSGEKWSPGVGGTQHIPKKKTVVPGGGDGIINTKKVTADPNLDFGVNIGQGLGGTDLARLFNNYYKLDMADSDTNPDSWNYDYTKNITTPNVSVEDVTVTTPDSTIDEVTEVATDKNFLENIRDITNRTKDQLIEMEIAGELKKGGRVGLLRGGDPNDYPQQEDVGTFELQQEEGVPIGPMVKNEFESDMLSALKQAYDEAVKKGYKGSFRQFIQEQGSGIRAAQGGMMSVLPKGKEMDYRGGGVIPIGSRERADDVPARLSKNEFVMTADAVKAAGGGSVNRGAKKMYNLMHNLEARV